MAARSCARSPDHARGGVGDRGGESGPALRLGVGRHEQLGDRLSIAISSVTPSSAWASRDIACTEQRRVDDQERVPLGRHGVLARLEQQPQPAGRAHPGGRGRRRPGDGAAQWPQNHSQCDGGIEPTFDES